MGPHTPTKNSQEYPSRVSMLLQPLMTSYDADDDDDDDDDHMMMIMIS